MGNPLEQGLHWACACRRNDRGCPAVRQSSIVRWLQVLTFMRQLPLQLAYDCISEGLSCVPLLIERGRRSAQLNIGAVLNGNFPPII